MFFNISFYHCHIPHLNHLVGGVNSLALCIVESIVTLLFCIVMIKVLEINKYLRFFLLGK